LIEGYEDILLSFYLFLEVVASTFRARVAKEA
jgi:hypothetical protein